MTAVCDPLYDHSMMIIKSFSLIFLSSFIYTISTTSPIAELIKNHGYAELYDGAHGTQVYDELYSCFDELIAFLHSNPSWAHTLYCARERFIRTTYKNYYSTDFFGFVDESSKKDRSQISFYYATHFDDFMCKHYPECHQVAQINRFFKLCRAIQQPYNEIFRAAAHDLGIKNMFNAATKQLPIILKVIKYLTHYHITRPHYDGAALALFLDSTDNQSLLLCPYHSSYKSDDFSVPTRQFHRSLHSNSIILIPGIFLTEWDIYPTPHIVMPSGSIRYATVAFAMRENYASKPIPFSPLVSIKR